MGCLTKQQIIDAKDLPKEKVFVPEWADGDPEAYVYVRRLSGKEWDEFELSISGENRNLKNLRARLLALVLVNDEGEQLFSPKEVELLGGKSSEVIGKLVEVAKRINKISKEAREEEVKNSESDQSEDSSSD